MPWPRRDRAQANHEQASAKAHVEHALEPAAGHSHAHSHNLRDIDVRTTRTIRLIAYLVLAVVAVATAIGLAALWPDYAKVSEIANRATYQVGDVTYVEGRVLSVNECEALVVPVAPVVPDASEAPANLEAPDAPAQAEAPPGRGLVQPACQSLSVGLLSGPDSGQVVDIDVRGTIAASGLHENDTVQLSSTPNYGAAQGEAAARYQLERAYEVSGIMRNLPLLILGLLFAAVVVAVGRIRGLFALFALVVAAGVLLAFVLPAIVAGGPGLLIGMVAASAIMFVTLFFVHGVNLRTASALLGTLAGILIIAGVSWIAVQTTRLSGLGDETSGLLSNMVSEIDFRGLLTCSILIAGLGVLNDVTITQASSVWELRAAAPQMTRREIYASAMRIGRDHIASTVYTVFFAYVGAAIGTLILLYLYNRPVLMLLTQEDIALEIVRTAAGSIGLILAVPITTAVAALFVPPAIETARFPRANPAHPTGSANPANPVNPATAEASADAAASAGADPRPDRYSIAPEIKPF